MDAENEEFRPEMGKKDDAWAKNGFSLLQNWRYLLIAGV